MTPVNKDTFEAEVLKSEAQVIVMFHKEGCRKCGIMDSTFKLFALENPEIKCFKYLCGPKPDSINGQFSISTFPALISFHKGETINKMEGLSLYEDIKKIFEPPTPSGTPLSKTPIPELKHLHKVVCEELKRRKAENPAVLGDPAEDDQCDSCQ